MEQQDAKNIITLEEFLTKLEGIISSFKEYVDTTNKRIDKVEENISILTKRIGDNNGNIKELTRDFGLQKDKITNQISDFRKTNEQSIKVVEETLLNKIQELKGAFEDKQKNNTEEVKQRTKTEKPVKKANSATSKSKTTKK